MAVNKEYLINTDTGPDRSRLSPVGEIVEGGGAGLKGKVTTGPIFKEEPMTSYRASQEDGGTVSNPDTDPTMFQHQNPGLTTDQWGEPINTRRPNVEGGQQTVVNDGNEQKPTGTGTGSPSDTPTASTASSTDTKKVIEGILKDPTAFIKENKLEQVYTPQTLTPEELMDPSKFQVGPTGDLVAATGGTPGAVTVDKINATTSADIDKVTAGTAGTSTALAPDKVVADVAATAQAKAAEDVKVADFAAALIDPGSLTKAIDEIAKVEPMKAASMAQHLDGLLQDLESGNVPVWARPAVAKVEQMLAARGISASSVGRDSLFNAIIQAAMPIAQQDATFEQDSHKTNYNAKVQAVLSDVNMEFAAKQFNANSINQTNQFKAQLKAQVDMQNAARKDAMSQWNASEANKMSMFNVSNKLQADQLNAQLGAQVGMFNAGEANKIGMFNVGNQLQADQLNAQMQIQNQQFNASESNKLGMFNAGNQLQASQFNIQTTLQASQFNAAQVNAMTQLTAQLQAQREQFNVQMASQIEQSNVNWRRQVNTANTAGINAVNQANVQNAFNLSNQALTFLWQEMRDKAHWEFQASESEKDRKNQLEAALLANETAMGGEIGRYLEGIIEGGKFLGNFLSSWK